MIISHENYVYYNFLFVCSGSRNSLNDKTKVYMKKFYTLLSRHIGLLCTDVPSNHLFGLNAFSGSGRIFSALSKTLDLIQPGETRTIDRVRVSINILVDKCTNQLKYISNNIW